MHRIFSRPISGNNLMVASAPPRFRFSARLPGPDVRLVCDQTLRRRTFVSGLSDCRSESLASICGALADAKPQCQYRSIPDHLIC